MAFNSKGPRLNRDDVFELTLDPGSVTNLTVTCRQLTHDIKKKVSYVSSKGIQVEWSDRTGGKVS